MKTLRLVPDDTKIDFTGMRFISFAVSIIMVLGTFALLATKGLNYGIDFTGGTMMEIAVPENPDLTKMREDLNHLGLGEISIQEFGDPKNLMIRLPQQHGADEAMQKTSIDKVKAAIDGEFSGKTVEYRRTEFVGPRVGEELKRAGLWAVLLSMGGILAYVGFRFEWQFGVAAVLSLIHDVVSTVGLFALTGMQFDLTALAAVLMLAGYSVNDTVVIFDRIREMLKKYRKTPLGDVLNISINSTLARTTRTSVVVLLTLIALWLFGGEALRVFTNAMIFGIVLGTYSSIFVAAPILLYLKLRPAAPNETVENALESAG